MNPLRHYISNEYSVASPYDGVAQWRNDLKKGRVVVVFDESEFLGVLSLIDIAANPFVLVGDSLTDKPLIPVESTLSLVYNIMCEQNVDYLPVVESDKFLGVIYRNKFLPDFLNGVLTSLNDELDELQSRLVSKNKFLMVFGHDVKNLFQQVEGTLELIGTSKSSLSPEQQNKLIEMSRYSAQQISFVFDNLLQWSRVSSGFLSFNPESVCVSTMVDGVMRHMELAANLKNITLCNIMDQCYHVEADPVMLKSIFINLVFNAIKFTPIGGKISIHAAPNASWLEIFVHDTGKGFEVGIDFKHKIAPSPPDMGGGTGLGLQLCKDFIEIHKGTIWIENPIEGGGKIVFTLPLKKKD